MARSHQIFLILIVSFSCSRIPSTIPHLVIMSQAPLDYYNFSNFSCFWWPWQYWGLQGILLDIPIRLCPMFSHDWLELRVLGEWAQRWSALLIPLYQWYTLSTWLTTADTSFAHQAEMESVKFLYSKVVPSPFPHCTEVTTSSHTWQRVIYPNYNSSASESCLFSITLIFISADTWIFTL